MLVRSVRRAFRLLVCAGALAWLACDTPAERSIVAPEPQFGEAMEQVITGRSFKFEIEDREIPLMGAGPGGFRCGLKDATMGNRGDGTKKTKKGKKKTKKGKPAEAGVECQLAAWEIIARSGAGLSQAFEEGRKLAGSLTYQLTLGDGSEEDSEEDGGSGVAPRPSAGAGAPTTFEVRTLSFSGAELVEHRLESDGDGSTVEVVRFSVQEMAVGDADSRDLPTVHGDADCWAVSGSELGWFGNGGQPTVLVLDDEVGAFDVAVDTGDGPLLAGGWHLARGGGFHCHCPFAGVADPDPTVLLREAYEPTPEIRLEGPLLSSGGRAELLDWVSRWMGGGRSRADLEVRMLDAPDGDLVHAEDFYRVIPVSYVPPSARQGDDSPWVESVVVRGFRVEDSDPPYGLSQ